jgi:4-hydroxyphenylpyruvate dioxygenase
MFSITTPFGDTTFRFVERKGYKPLFPGLVEHAKPIGGNNAFGFKAVDHITTNFQTMSPALLWMEHVLGFERFWTVQFHTSDVTKEAQEGSGLKSVVMVDPHSPVKFANNEPMRPFFKDSQINIFAEDHRGDGVQHAALTVGNIIETVRGMRGKNIEFMPTPGAYYDMMPERLKEIGVGSIDENIDILRELEILVDGEAARKYLLQIFLKESSHHLGDKNAGPFFFEIIQRKGSNGFGAGNFRALFESIERQQREERGLGARVS